jgi:hypothetical protein
MTTAHKSEKKCEGLLFPTLSAKNAGGIGHPRLALCALLLALLCLRASAQRAPYLPPAFAAAGVVVDSVTGDPVRGATVQLKPQHEERVLTQVRTGDDGSFRLAPQPAGKYQLRALRPGYRPSLYEQHGNFNSALVLGPAQETGHILFRLPPRSVLYGVVTDDAGDPVAGARVLLFRRTGVEEATSKIYPNNSTTTDETGTYEFARQWPGDFMIAVVAEPWYALHRSGPSTSLPPELDVAYPVTYYDSTTDEASAATLHLNHGNRIEANIILHAVPALHISVPQPRGRSNNEGDPVLHQSIFGSFADEDPNFPDLPSSIDGLAPGRYEMTVGDPPRIVAFDATASGPVDLVRSAPAATLTGTVETTSGVPLDQLARLLLYPDDPDQHMLHTVVRQGRFSLDNLPAGTWTAKLENGYGYAYRVTFIQIGKRKFPGARFAFGGQPTEVTLTAVEGAVSLEGFALRDGKGLAGTMVVLVPRDLQQIPVLARRDQSDSDGSFSLSNVFPGTYTLVALADAWELDWSRPETIARYLPGGQSVTVSAGASGIERLPQPVAVQAR